MVLVEGAYYRASTIIKLKGVDPLNPLELEANHMPVSYGIAIEKKCPYKTQDKLGDFYYIVVGFVKPKKDRKKEVVFEDVLFRSIETLEPLNRLSVEEYVNTVAFAKQAVLDAMGD